MGHDPVTTYALDVTQGKILSCKKVIQAAERHIQDLNRSDIWFDEEAADLVCDFASSLQHAKGKWANQPIVLEPWQRFVLGSLYGWRVKSTGLRRFRTGYIQVPRKNTKSTLSAIVGMYSLIELNQRNSKRICTLKAKQFQGSYELQYALQLALTQPLLRNRLTVSRAGIKDWLTGSYWGYQTPSLDLTDYSDLQCVLVDDLQMRQGKPLWGLLNQATAHLKQSLLLATCTAHWELAGIYLEKYDQCAQMLSGDGRDDSIFAFITEMDEGDDWTDPKVWHKANPNIGVSVSLESIQERAKEAQKSVFHEAHFRSVFLNQWVAM